jgi:Kinase non-catalytic C-lobe domain
MDENDSFTGVLVGNNMNEMNQNDDVDNVTMLTHNNNCSDKISSEPSTSDSENNENNMNRKNQQQKSNSKKIQEHKACNKKILKEFSNVKNTIDTENTISLEEILKSFNAPISEEQAWSLIFQTVAMYKHKLNNKLDTFRDLHAPVAPRNLFVRKDGTVFVSCKNEGESRIINFLFSHSCCHFMFLSPILFPNAFLCYGVNDLEFT